MLSKYKCSTDIVLSMDSTTMVVLMGISRDLVGGFHSLQVYPEMVGN